MRIALGVGLEFGPLSLLPPLLAIILCMATKQVLPALFLGVWVGALLVAAGNPLTATTQTLEWIIGNVTDSWNATILLFDFIIGAMVALMYASGAMHSVAEAIGRRVKSAKGASFASWVLGLVIFFDDYTNTIVVGNSMRPLTDRLKVSRELLSYIVDSTAAPVAGLALMSTWIGYEVSLIKDAFAELTPKPEVSAYAAWLMSVPYRYYSILAIILVLLVILTRRHYGPMLKAEHRVVKEGKVVRDGAVPLMPTESVLGEAKPSRIAGPSVFALPVIVLVAMTILGMWITGAEDPAKWWETPFVDALMNADAAKALLWASFAGYLVASALVMGGKYLKFREWMDYTLKGMYLMVLPNAILTLAWSIKTACDEVGTADYIVGLAKAAGVPALLVPAVIFLAACFISFTTGTSWGTFGIMMPLAIPMAWYLAQAQGVDPYIVTYASIASVFAGGIFGDHCSPISDTTIMSSMFSASDHIDHVNTQIPYAVTAAAVSAILFALFAAGFVHPAILLPVGIVLLIALHRVLNIWYAKQVGLPPIVPDLKVTSSETTSESGETK